MNLLSSYFTALGRLASPQDISGLMAHILLDNSPYQAGGAFLEGRNWWLNRVDLQLLSHVNVGGSKFTDNSQYILAGHHCSTYSAGPFFMKLITTLPFSGS